tara:strand:+ start:1091 stop:1336 length:246 start_codon:yes stop_codon:yes gene_type:complete
MTNAEIFKLAGLGVTETALVDIYLEDDDGRFIETKAFEKLFDYFLNSGEMPYRVAKAIDHEPDVWILDRLQASETHWTHLV